MSEPNVTISQPTLNLPNYSDRLRIRKNGTNTLIWDMIRCKWLKLTPEEWIRQNMTLYIVDTLQVTPNRIANETEICYNKLRRRCDSVIFAPNGTPLIVVEYKKTQIPITQQVFDQAALYCMHLSVPYLIVSNGLQHLLCQIDLVNRRYVFAPKWPTYDELVKQTKL